LNEKIKIEVTPNLKKCLEVLKDVVQELSPGELKDKSDGALEYMSRTFKGESQPNEGISCFPGMPFIPGG
jgi:hypothetical protein